MKRITGLFVVFLFVLGFAFTKSASAQLATPTVSINANPTTITAGQNALLSWSSTNASSCTEQIGNGGSQSIQTSSPTLGILPSVAPTQTTTYTITCSNSAGSSSSSATITVNAVPKGYQGMCDNPAAIYNSVTDAKCPPLPVGSGNTLGSYHDNNFGQLSGSGGKIFYSTDINTPAVQASSLDAVLTAESALPAGCTVTPEARARLSTGWAVLLFPNSSGCGASYIETAAVAGYASLWASTPVCRPATALFLADLYDAHTGLQCPPPGTFTPPAPNTITVISNNPNASWTIYNAPNTATGQGSTWGAGGSGTRFVYTVPTGTYLVTPGVIATMTATVTSSSGGTSLVMSSGSIGTFTITYSPTTSASTNTTQNNTTNNVTPPASPANNVDTATAALIQQLMDQITALQAQIAAMTGGQTPSGGGPSGGAAPAGSFNAGDSVVTTGRPNVRDAGTVTANIIGTQTPGNSGTVVGGPTNADGYTWWDVSYANGLSGWSIENYLTDTSAGGTTPNPAPNPGTSALVVTDTSSGTPTYNPNPPANNNSLLPAGYTEVYTQHNYNKTWHVFYSASARNWMTKKTDDKTGATDWTHGPIAYDKNLVSLGNECTLIDNESSRNGCIGTTISGSITALTGNSPLIKVQGVPEKIVYTFNPSNSAIYYVQYDPTQTSWLSVKEQNGMTTWTHPNLSAGGLFSECSLLYSDSNVPAYVFSLAQVQINDCAYSSVLGAYGNTTANPPTQPPTATSLVPSGYTQVYTITTAPPPTQFIVFTISPKVYTWYVFYSPSTRTWITKKTDASGGTIYWTRGPISYDKNLVSLGNECTLIDSDSAHNGCIGSTIAGSIKAITSNNTLTRIQGIPEKTVYTFPANSATYYMQYDPYEMSWLSSKDQKGMTTWTHSNISASGLYNECNFLYSDANLATSLFQVQINDCAYSSVLGAYGVTSNTPPTPPTSTGNGPTITVTANPMAIKTGQTATLTFTVTPAGGACALDQGVSVAMGLTFIVGPTKNTTYTLTCTNSGGTTSKSITITVTDAVQPPPSQAPTITITLLGSNPMNLTVGQVYVEPGATATDAQGNNLTSKVIITGSPSYPPNTNAVSSYKVTYNITDSSGLTSTQTRTVNVVAVSSGAPTASISVNPLSITAGQHATLTWSSTDATSCSEQFSTFSGSVTIQTSSAGLDSSYTDITPTKTVTYTLICKNSAGVNSAPATATLTVNPVSPSSTGQTLSITKFLSDNTSVVAGQPVIITWETTGATSCNMGATSDSIIEYPTSTTIYTLRCNDATGNIVSKQITITAQQTGGGGGGTGGGQIITTPVSVAPSNNTTQVASVAQGLQNLLDALTSYLKGQ